jgi:asparagine synthase (glutamine-hydrolysing)
MMSFFKVAGFLPSAIRASLTRHPGFAWNRNDRSRKLQMMLAAEPTAAYAYMVARGLFAPLRRDALFRMTEPEVLRRALHPVAEAAEDCSGLDRINQVSFLELRNYVANTLLRDADVMGMAHGLEIRQPYLDHKLVEFLFTLPGNYKRSRTSPKWLLTNSLGAELPKEVVHRAKRGFLLPFDRWLRKELRPEVEAVLCAEDRSSTGILDTETVHTVWRDFLAGRASWSRPWSLYVLKRWMRLFHSEEPHALEEAVVCAGARTD